MSFKLEELKEKVNDLEYQQKLLIDSLLCLICKNEERFSSVALLLRITKQESEEMENFFFEVTVKDLTAKEIFVRFSEKFPTRKHYLKRIVSSYNRMLLFPKLGKTFNSYVE